MSFLTKKNPYDKFKLNYTHSTIKPKKKARPFSSNTTNRSMLLNTILKGTKSILKNKIKFTGYMNEYRSIVARATFKRPDIQSYPLLRKENASMIPIKSQKREKPKPKDLMKYLLSKPLQSGFSFREKFKHKINMSMSLENKLNNSIKKEKDKEKEKSLLFSDFFYKWNNNNESVGANNFNSHYSDLNYDENEIFYSDYSDFIKEKTTYLLKDKIENLQKKLKIQFVDSEKKKIKMQLISMKLIFEPFNKDRISNYKKDYNFEDYKEINNYNSNNINDEGIEEENDDDENTNININKNIIKGKNIITIPLSYVFLFYINGIDFFKNILLASIKFSNDFKKIYFEEEEIYNAIRKERGQKRMKLQKKHNNRYYEHKNSVKQFSKINLIKKNTNKNNDGKKSEKDNAGYTDISINESNKNDDNSNILYHTNKNIVTIHSNPDLRKKEANTNILHNKKMNEIKYTEYSFIWETPNNTYRIRMIMPIIIFWSEHIKKNIVLYCDKKLFLFLLKNNFINWDYYILNYLFSIKIFRKIILSGLSFYTNRKIYNMKLSSPNKSDIKECIFSQLDKTDNSVFSFINEKTIFLNANKKSYNNLNENNESYIFFYTDNFNVNSIIDFHSYHIFIEYDKLNAKNCWEFALNFKQMNYLSYIDKYESLDTFLPKIVYTNFEDHTLALDFSVFEYFNKNIFDHRKSKIKEKYETNKNDLIKLNVNNNDNDNNTKKKINNDMVLSIKMPYVVVEQYDKSKLLSNNVQKICLSSNLLKLLHNCRNVYWSKRILHLLNFKTNNLEEDDQYSLDLWKNESSPIFNCSINDESKINNIEHEKKIVNYHNYKYKKISKSFHFKKKQVHF